ncbi:hypothetical protein pb186bvf_003213 [Paramecium bursaria]
MRQLKINELPKEIYPFNVNYPNYFSYQLEKMRLDNSAVKKYQIKTDLDKPIKFTRQLTMFRNPTPDIQRPRTSQTFFQFQIKKNPRRVKTQENLTKSRTSSVSTAANLHNRQKSLYLTHSKLLNDSTTFSFDIQSKLKRELDQILNQCNI